MTRTGRFVFLAAAVVAMAMPRAASAQGGLIDFIESLSGPGPFRGGGFVLRLGCMTTTNQTSFRGTTTDGWKYESCLNDEDVRVANDPRRIRQVVELRGLWASTPEGKRPVLLADPDDTRNVDTFKLDMVATFRIAPFLDVGAGGGLMRFTVADGVVNGVSRDGTTVYRPIIVPVSITATPLAVYRPTAAVPSGAGKFRRVVRLRLDVNYIPFGFTGSSWGKPEIPTNVYSTDGNWVLSGGVILDAGPFLGNR